MEFIINEYQLLTHDLVNNLRPRHQDMDYFMAQIEFLDRLIQASYEEEE